MALPADYISGTITLTNGSPDFTGTGTGWQAADFREGDILLGVEDHAGQVYVIATITGNAAGTLTQDWAGTSGTYTYRMRYEWDSSRVSAQARAMVELLGNGNLEALAGLTGAPDQVPVFTGPGAMTLVPTSSFVPANGSITNPKLANVPTATVKGRSAAGAGAPTDLTMPQLLALLANVGNFARNNALGTVSQSGGVPTGAIIEAGSNANGNYVRFADGTQICRGSVNVPSATQAVGSGFITTSSDRPVWTYPVAFVTGAPTVTCNVNVVGGVGATVPSFGLSNCTIILTSFSSATGNFAISVLAIGRWF